MTSRDEDDPPRNPSQQTPAKPGDHRNEPVRPDPAKPDPTKLEAQDRRYKSNAGLIAGVIVGTMVHYTDPEERRDLIDADEQLRRRSAGIAPMQRVPPRVLAALIVRIDNAETGAVCLRVFHGSSSNDDIIPNCPPSDAAAGSLQARGQWTPMDRPLYNWGEEDRERAVTQHQPPSGVDPQRGPR